MWKLKLHPLHGHNMSYIPKKLCLFVCLLMHEIYFYAHSYGSLKGYYRGMSQNVYYGWNSVWFYNGTYTVHKYLDSDTTFVI